MLGFGVRHRLVSVRVGVVVAMTLLKRAIAARPDRPLGVVLAVREYEAWLLAGLGALRGKRTLPESLEAPEHPEAIRDAKGWFDSRMERGHAETLEQAKLTSHFDLDEARRAQSFDKLVREVCRLLGKPVPATGDPAGV